MDNKEKIEKIVKDAKDLLSIFEEFKEKAEANNKSLIFKYIDRVVIAKNIVPYLNLKDIINFRSTCRDINASVSSTVALVSFYKAMNDKKSSTGPDMNNVLLKPFSDLNDTEDVYAQLESTKKVSIEII